jgi:hypothetical protein
MTMPAPIPWSLRQRILAYQQRGLSAAMIARQLDLCARTVRALCVQFRARGAAVLEPAYRRPAAAGPSAVVQQALLLHEQHPSWGAPYLLLQLRQRHPACRTLPSARTLQRWFARRRQPPAPAGRKPGQTRVPARQPHEVWQMDAVEQLPLQTGQHVSWLRWVDELTGAVLGTAVFPPRQLRPGAGVGGPGGITPAVWPLGLAGVSAGGQRPALGE